MNTGMLGIILQRYPQCSLLVVHEGNKYVVQIRTSDKKLAIGHHASLSLAASKAMQELG